MFKFNLARRSGPALWPAATLILALFVLLQTGPGWACIGEIPGFPRQIRLDREKSDPGQGLFVRVFTIQGQDWYIPNPAGFADIELRSSRAELAHWEEVAAYNLRDGNLAFFAAADAVPPRPRFSQAHLYIERERGEAERQAEFSLAAGQPTTEAALAEALRQLLSRGQPLEERLFARVAAGDYAGYPYIFLEQDGQKVLVRLRIVEGQMTEADLRQREELLQAQEAGPTLNPDGTISLPPELPVGSGHVSWYPSLETSLVFKSGQDYVSLLINYGPLTEQQQIVEAVKLLLDWQAAFKKANP